LGNAGYRTQGPHGKADRQSRGERSAFQVPTGFQAESSNRQRKGAGSRTPVQRAKTDIKQHTKPGRCDRTAGDLVEK
jgi:hypothetical protein